METDGLSCPAAAAPAAAAAAAADPQVAAASEEGVILCSLYAWLDTLPLSRPKRNLHRDFADGVLMAEVANHCIPRIADLHNYSTANSFNQKRYNWQTLAEKVFKRVGVRLPQAEIEEVIAAKPGAIERVLLKFKSKAEMLKREGSRGSSESQAAARASHASPAPPSESHSQQEWETLLADRDATIRELEETNAILNAKADSLQKLLQLRDAKIELLTKALQAASGPAKP